MRSRAALPPMQYTRDTDSFERRSWCVLCVFHKRKSMHKSRRSPNSSTSVVCPALLNYHMSATVLSWNNKNEIHVDLS